jgi:Mg2+ and Co2+ transporter CorA
MAMIRSTYVLENKLVTLTGFPPSQELDAKVVWLDIAAPTPEELAELRQRYRIDPGAHRGSVVEENEYLYMRAYLVMPGAERAPKFGRVAFVLGERIIVTICDAPDFAPFGAATQRWGRRAAQIDSAKALLRVLLQAVNDGADLVIENITDSLEETTDQISAISDGYNEEGKELGVSDLEDTMLDLNEKEEPREILLQEAIASGNLDLAQAGLKELHPSQIADLLESLPPRERDMLWERVQPEQVGEVLAHVQDAVRAALLEPMAPGEVASLTERLDTDDAADILQDLPEDRVEEVLRSMDEQHRQRLASILSYPEDTAHLARYQPGHSLSRCLRHRFIRSLDTEGRRPGGADANSGQHGR